MDLDEITGAIVEMAVKIHMDLGPGLLELVYEAVLARALQRRGFRVERQKPVSCEYDGMWFEEGFRVDLVVEDRAVIELKSVEKLAPVHSKQLLTYLRFMDLRIALLLNFGADTLKQGLHRVVNKLPWLKDHACGARGGLLARREHGKRRRTADVFLTGARHGKNFQWHQGGPTPDRHRKTNWGGIVS